LVFPAKEDNRYSAHQSSHKGLVVAAAIGIVGFVWVWSWAFWPAYVDPASFPLTKPMREQYVTLFPSGYGLREAISALPQTVGSQPVIASMTSDGCRRALFYLSSPLSVDCVGTAQGQDQIKQALGKAGVAYVLAEDQPIGPDPAAVQATWTQIAVYPRPGNLSRVTLWKVTP
jgi:hypothetical protein